MKAFYERARQLRNATSAQTPPEHSPVGGSQPNGVVKEAIKDVEEMLGTILSATEEAVGGKIPQESAVIAWAAEYSPTLIKYDRESADKKNPS